MIAQMLDAEIEGDANCIITGPSSIEKGIPGTLTFLDHPKYEPFIYKTLASAVLVSKDFIPNQPLTPTLIKVTNVKKSLQVLFKWYESQLNRAEYTPGIHPTSIIHPTAQIASSAHIGPWCVIEEHVVIGENAIIEAHNFIGLSSHVGEHTHLYAGVRIMHNSTIGHHCRIFANAVIGSDGFGYSNDGRGYELIPQMGVVVIGNHVEIGAATVIDRALMGRTYIADGVIMDNLVHIGHNVEIGESTAIAAQTGIAGSTKIGARCVIGGQVGIAGHLKIADDTKIQAKSGVSKASKPHDRLFGYPAIDYNDYLRSYVLFKQLPKLNAEVEALQKKIASLEELLDQKSIVNGTFHSR